MFLLSQQRNRSDNIIAKIGGFVMAKKLTDKEIDNIAKVTGAELKGVEKVRIKIPADPLNPKDNVVPVGINGYNYLVKRGETVELPTEVVRISEEAKYI